MKHGISICLLLLLFGCDSGRKYTVIVTLSHPTSFEKMIPAQPIVEFIHDSDVLVPAYIESIPAGTCPYAVGTSVYFLVDDPARFFGSANPAGKRYEITLHETEPGMWERKVTPL